MRLDHLLSREYSEGGNAGAQTEVDEEASVLQHGECFPCYSCQRLRAKANEALETAIATNEEFEAKNTLSVESADKDSALHLS